ncbi:hypothetical protein P8605_00625 [Streptomyces sp. T-3]|nr:hypothetical protein [Streptomyces sp. T-3]
MTLFGMAYAASSLGCTIAPFLTIAVSAFRSGSTGQGIVLFVAYAAGMGLVVAVASLSVALTHTAAVSRLRRFGAIAPRLGGALLTLVGSYVAYCGWYEIRVQRNPTLQDPVIDAAGTVQRTIADAVDGLGPWTFAATAVALLTVAWAVHRRRRARHNSANLPTARL